MTGPPGTGGTPPEPAGYVVPDLPGVAAGSRNTIRARLIIVFGTGANTGLFVYSGTPAAGNPPIFWATSASADPFGNAIPSTAGVASSGVFKAGNTLVNANGIFVYSGTPAAGNLIASLCPVAVTDPFGNVAVQGFGEYATVAGNLIKISIGTAIGSMALQFHNATSPEFLTPSVFAQPGAGSCTISLDSGKTLSTSVDAQVFCQDSTGSLLPNGLVKATATQVILGAAGNAFWTDAAGTGTPNGSLNLPASGGPYITNEGFHTLTNPAGITGTARVKKFPWNAVWYEGRVTWSGTTGTTLTFGAPPDGTYNPTSAFPWPVGTNATPSAVSAPGRLFIPTSGGPQLITPTVTGANTNWTWSLMIPTN